jgi:hypothetical protein
MKFTKLLFYLLFIQALTSCTKGPSTVAESFLNDLTNNKFEEAKKLSTPDAQAVLDGFMKEGSTNPNASKWSYKITKEETSGDISTVHFLNMPVGKPELKQTVRLVKKDGNWFVANMTIEK